MGIGERTPPRPEPQGRLGPAGGVVLVVADPAPPSLNLALEQAGYQVESCVDAAAVVNNPNALQSCCAVVVDTGCLLSAAALQATVALANEMPLALLTRPQPGPVAPGLEDIPAVAALPFPPDPAVIIASLPYWRTRHAGLKALQAIESGLQEALIGSRSISNAVGVLAERHGLSMAEAFEMIRSEARSRRQRLEQVAQNIVDQAGSAPLRAPDRPAF